MVDAPKVVPEGTLGYGIQLPVQSQSTIYVDEWESAAGPAELAAVARQAEASGFLYVAVCDHTAIPRRLAQAMGATWYDTVATLGWLAALTTEVRLLSHVYIAAQRHPLRAAKEFATLDTLSGGRVIIGVGAGHVVEEFEAFGVDFEHRGGALDEAIEAMAVALSNDFADLPGPRWPARDMAVSPRPRQQPRPPFWIGGSSPAALRRAARFGEGWLPQTPKPSDMAELIPRLLEMREQFRPGRAIEVGALGGPLHVGEATWELPRGTLSGAPERLAQAMGAWQEMGVSHVQLRFPGRSCAEVCDQIEAFGAEVAPLLGRSTPPGPAPRR
ncbi:MAG: TIGR03619 family F420-dependent LLM class oxidoreductase [Acidimicrobiales bacterium]